MSVRKVPWYTYRSCNSRCEKLKEKFWKILILPFFKLNWAQYLAQNIRIRNINLPFNFRLMRKAKSLFTPMWLYTSRTKVKIFKAMFKKQAELWTFYSQLLFCHQICFYYLLEKIDIFLSKKMIIKLLLWKF